jgi:nicotinamidase-related amidase
MSAVLETIDSKSTAIIVLDVQPVIMSMIQGSEERLKSIVEAIEAGQKKDCLTVYVRVAFTHEEWSHINSNVKNFHEMKIQMGNQNSAPEFIHVDGQASALHPQVQELVNKGSHLLIRKNRFGPFIKTNLLQELQERRIQNLIVVGFKTSGAVLSTVRFAADHDFKVIVVRDAVLDPDIELDEVLLDKILPEQAHVVTLAEMERALLV